LIRSWWPAHTSLGAHNSACTLKRTSVAAFGGRVVG
jgi:hypothetical protein